MMKYLESSSAGEIKTCISNIRISLNFWESLKRNTLFVKHQQPFLFLIFCVKLLLSFLESDETNEIKLETRCFSSLRLTDYRRRAPISLLWETPLSQSNQSCSASRKRLWNQKVKPWTLHPIFLCCFSSHETEKLANVCITYMASPAGHVFVALFNPEVYWYNFLPT